MSNVALSMLALSAVAVIGLWIGNIKIKGVGLGIGGVLFGGLIVGHFVYALNWQLDEHALHFIKEFGLILFVYTIGIQVGPGFFASLKANGIVLNGLAAAIVVLGGLVGVVMLFVFDIPLHVFLGIYSGAVTNTPSLAAGQQILQELGMASDKTEMLGLGYAMAYPFGILGILLSMWLVRLVFKINIDKEAADFDGHGPADKSLHNVNVVVDNRNIDGMTFEELSTILGEDVMCSRIKSSNILKVPEPDTIVNAGDFLHLVAETDELLHKATVIIGEVVNESMSTKGTHMKSVRIVVTEEKMLGKKLSKLNLKHRFHVVLSRQNRAGVELIPGRDSTLQFGDVLNIVGGEKDVEKVAKLLGNTSQKLQHVQMLPIFLGIGLGVLLGSIPLHLPQLPAPLKLGLAGGPLIVAIILQIFYNYCVSKIDSLVSEMEEASLELVDLLTKHGLSK